MSMLNPKRLSYALLGAVFFDLLTSTYALTGTPSSQLLQEPKGVLTQVNTSTRSSENRSRMLVPDEPTKTAFATAVQPSAELTKKQEERDRKSWQAVWIFSAMILIAISPILVKEGLVPFITVVTYLSCLSLVKMYVKEVIASGWAYADTITAMHMLCTAIFAAAFEKPKLSEAFMVLPISAVNGFSLLLNNQALVHAGVAFVSMVAACTPMFTFGFEIGRGRRNFELLNAAPVAVVCVGATFCIHGERAGSVLALCLAGGGTAFRAMKSVWQHELLTVSVSPMRLLFWNGFWSFWISLMMMLPTEGFEGVRSFHATSSKTKMSFFLSVCAACMLNCSQCYAVKQLGALMQSIAGNLNLVLVIMLSQAWLHEEVSIWQYCGVALLVSGTFLSKMLDKGKGAGAKSEKLTEKTSLSTPNPPESTSYNSTATTGNAEAVLSAATSPKD